uniref:Protein FAM160B1 n=1 Tax=Schistosoma mansoni TaxID=6183 RepID=A0A5K4F296_SCHMA
MPKSVSSCIPSSAGHPWLSDGVARFTEVAQRCVVLDEQVSCSETSTGHRNNEDCFKLSEAIYKTLNDAFSDLISDPTCQPNWQSDVSNAEFINFQEDVDQNYIKYQIDLMKKFCHVDESVLISIAGNLQKCLHSTHCSLNGSTWLLHLFVIAFFVSYVRYFQKLPSRSLMLSIFELSPDPFISHQLYASLLPEVLSIPDHRQGEYILNFLKNATPSHCYTLLCKLCTLDSNWPVDSYSVLEFLFDPCLAYVSSTPELSPGELFVAVVNKFYHDAQKDSSLRKSIKFTNMIIKFLRNYANYYPSLQYPKESQLILKQLASENCTFLRNTLNNFVC